MIFHSLLFPFAMPLLEQKSALLAFQGNLNHYIR
jgi:hypothetical protein